MVLSFDFCERRALDAAMAAAGAKLDNVRERELRSQAAWLAMAAKMKAVVDARTLRDLAADASLMAEADNGSDADFAPPA